MLLLKLDTLIYKDVYRIVQAHNIKINIVMINMNLLLME